MATATYLGGGASIDYTPGSAVSAGDVVVQGSLIGVATRAIAANVLGALAVSGLFTMPCAAGGTSPLTVGTKVYWDADNLIVTATAGELKGFGYVTRTAGATDTTVEVLKVNF
jgi:predicted RecA/RadA family phage recombinase